MAKTTKKQKRTGERKTAKAGKKKPTRKDVIRSMKNHGVGFDDHDILGEEHEQFGLYHNPQIKDPKPESTTPQLEKI